MCGPCVPAHSPECAKREVAPEREACGSRTGAASRCYMCGMMKCDGCVHSTEECLRLRRKGWVCAVGSCDGSDLTRCRRCTFRFCSAHWAHECPNSGRGTSVGTPQPAQRPAASSQAPPPRAAPPATVVVERSATDEAEIAQLRTELLAQERAHQVQSERHRAEEARLLQAEIDMERERGRQQEFQ